MKASEIAENLKRSRKRWGVESLYDADNGTYCVLGIKASERGVKKRTLLLVDTDNVNMKRWRGLDDLIGINDGCDYKRELIDGLERIPNRVFNVEGFVDYLLKRQEQLEAMDEG